MKELDEAKDKIIETIRWDAYATLGLSDFHRGTYKEKYTNEGIQDAINLASKILNLKGDGWKIAIVGTDPGRSYAKHCVEEYLPVIWEAGDG